jgi:hypothetical protein
MRRGCGKIFAAFRAEMAWLRPRGVAQARRFNRSAAANQRRAAVGADCYQHTMPAKSDLKRLAAAVRDAEREFHAARGRGSLNAAVRRMMRTKAELKAAQAERSLSSCVEAMERLQGSPVAPRS